MAFRFDQPCHNHIGQKGGDRQEDGRHDPRHVLLLGDFALQELVRGLVGATVGTDAAEGSQEAVEPADNVFFVSARQQTERDAVEKCLEVEGSRQSIVPHPRDAEALVVRHEVAAIA